MQPIWMKQNSLVGSIKYLLGVLIIGIGIGLMVSLVSSLFVFLIKWFIETRSISNNDFLKFPGTELSLMPMF